MSRAIVGIGGNLGEGRAIFACAEGLLVAQAGCQILARSSLYRSAPLGPPQPDYLNAALVLEYAGEAHALLEQLRQVEQGLGRARRERWGARTLDLDLLEWSEGPVDTPTLVVPHPEMRRRAFVLAPLLDVAPELHTAYAEALCALGGAPPLAVPGWPTRFDPGFVSPNEGLATLRARAELLVRAVERCEELPSFGEPRPRA